MVATEEEEDLEAGFDKDFIKDISKQRVGADIEEASIEDWDHWLGIQDGDFDCVEVHWYDKDNVLTDEKGNPIENPEKYIGFDVAQKFEEYSAESTGDPDIRVIYNHNESAIFYITRIHASYDRKTAMEEYGNDGEDDDEYERIHSKYE